MDDRDEVGQHAAAVHRRDMAQGLRLLVVAAIVVALVLVGLDNRSDVRVGYVFGDSSAPVWIVVVAAAAAGVVVGWLLRHRPRRGE